MTDSDVKPARLTDDDFAFLLMVLRNSPRPVTMQQLIEALRQQGARSS